jgi:hypothetical protein
MKMFIKIIQQNGELNTSKPKSEPERARLRIMSGTQLLKLIQEVCFQSLLTAEFFHVLARLMIVNKNLI